MQNNILISVVIPTYEMKGFGEKFLRQSFEILKKQTFKDFEVVISDQSTDDSIKNLCSEFGNELNIKYINNKEGARNTSANLNNAIKNSSGKLIKILFQDDFLYGENSLEKIVRNFDLEKDSWLVAACTHSKDGVNFYNPFYPKYNKNIHIGKNTVSSPSVLTMKNDNPLLFDEKLIWRMDTDYYKRCFDKFGLPKIVNEITVVNRIGEHQVTNTLINKKIIENEYLYLLKKYNENFIVTKKLIFKIKEFLRIIKNQI